MTSYNNEKLEKKKSDREEYKSHQTQKQQKKMERKERCLKNKDKEEEGKEVNASTTRYESSHRRHSLPHLVPYRSQLLLKGTPSAALPSSL